MGKNGKLKEMIDSIEYFSERCAKNEHTDTGEAWDLLVELQTKMTEMVYGRP